MEGRRRFALHTKILLGLGIGIAAGIAVQATLGPEHAGLKDFVKNFTNPVGQIFLRLIFMIVVPLLFAALVLGVAEIGDARRIGRVGTRALLLTLALSSVAVVIGLLLVNAFNPGAGIDPARREQLMATYGSKDAEKAVEQSKKAKTLAETLVEIIPKNPIEDVAFYLNPTDTPSGSGGGLLAFMFFALVFGIALAGIEPARAAPVKAFLDGLFAVSLKIIEFAMHFAPIGVAALVFGAVSLLGPDALLSMLKYVLVVLFGLLFHQFVVYSLVLRLIAKRNPWEFFTQIRAVMATAFATSSSNATLPTALKSAQEDVRLPRDISSFVLTVGATGNQNGTALFEGITIIFLAQFFGVALSIGDQVGIMGLAIVAGIGTAGVPGGAWPMIAIILARYGIPPEAIGIVMGIDRLLDMSRTVLNVTGDITIAACVSEMEARTRARSAEPVTT